MSEKEKIEEIKKSRRWRKFSVKYPLSRRRM